VNTGLPIFSGILLGGASGMITSYLIGHITLKMRAIYLSITTWVVAETVLIILRLSYQFTGGDLGLVTPLMYGPRVSLFPYYYTYLLFMLACLVALYGIVRSKVGLFIRSIREDEEASSTMGVDTVKWKKVVFSISGLIAGLNGGFYAHYLGSISPSIGDFTEMIIIVVMVMIGGYGTFWGPVIGGFTVEILSEYFRVIGEWKMVFFGLAALLIARVFKFGGIVEFLKRARVWVWRSSSAPVRPEENSQNKQQSAR
jgi:branched-chain amino acid transport system permease protein